MVDTALALQMTRAVDLSVGAAADLENTIAKRAREFRGTPMVGRTHGIHAEPTTFGAKIAVAQERGISLLTLPGPPLPSFGTLPPHGLPPARLGPLGLRFRICLTPGWRRPASTPPQA